MASCHLFVLRDVLHRHAHPYGAPQRIADDFGLFMDNALTSSGEEKTIVHAVGPVLLGRLLPDAVNPRFIVRVSRGQKRLARRQMALGGEPKKMVRALSTVQGVRLGVPIPRP